MPLMMKSGRSLGIDAGVANCSPRLISTPKCPRRYFESPSCFMKSWLSQNNHS